MGDTPAPPGVISGDTRSAGDSPGPRDGGDEGDEVAKTDSLGTEAKDLVDLVVDYAKQETLDPIKGLGKNVAFGVAGAALIGIGGVFLGLAALRALQTETDAFEDNFSWAPYLILTVVLFVGAGVSWVGLGPRSKEKGQ